MPVYAYIPKDHLAAFENLKVDDFKLEAFEFDAGEETEVEVFVEDVDVDALVL